MIIDGPDGKPMRISWPKGERVDLREADRIAMKAVESVAKKCGHRHALVVFVFDQDTGDIGTAEFGTADAVAELSVHVYRETARVHRKLVRKSKELDKEKMRRLADDGVRIRKELDERISRMTTVTSDDLNRRSD